MSPAYSHPAAAEAVRSTNGKEIWLDGHCWTLAGGQEAKVTVANLYYTHHGLAVGT